jgi:hypothetical protein
LEIVEQPDQLVGRAGDPPGVRGAARLVGRERRVEQRAGAQLDHGQRRLRIQSDQGPVVASSCGPR